MLAEFAEPGMRPRLSQQKKPSYGSSKSHSNVVKVGQSVSANIQDPREEEKKTLANTPTHGTPTANQDQRMSIPMPPEPYPVR